MENSSEIGSGDKNRTLSESSDTGIDFAPLITLPEVPAVTNEEDEEVLLISRAKLYRFDTKKSETPEWVERGTGEVKILHHPENNSARLVMRRDKTFKVCANHFITPSMELRPCAGSEKAFLYVVNGDFAFEELTSECFAFKFRNSECANQFKEKFEEAKKIVKEKCELYCEKSLNEEDEDVSDDKNENKKEENEVKKEEQKEKDNLTKKMSELEVKND